MAYDYTAYNGTNDFRGFLAANAPSFLSIAGNDGHIDQNAYLKSQYGSPATGYSTDQTNNAVYMDSVINGLYDKWQGSQGGGSTYSGPDYSQINANTISQLSQGAGTINNALGRLPGQLDIANSNINNRYTTKNNELQTGYNNNQNSYNTQTTQNQQSFRTNKNSINDQASQGLRGLSRLLGAYGAVGSDLGVAQQSVMNQASRQNAGAGLNYATNQSGLDTNWGNFENSFKNERKKLNDWKTEQLASAEQQSTTTRQDLMSKLADLNGQIAAARGGSYAGAAQPYLDQANALSSKIDSLGKLNPTYDGVTPVYTAPSLSSYNVGNPVSYGFTNNGTSAADTPYLSLLLGKDDKNKQPVAG